MRRSVVRGGLAVVIVAGVVTTALVGAGNTGPERERRLGSGAAWLSSGRVGQVTLLDGSSVEVAAQVQVGQRDHAIDVVQQGQNVYVVDRTAGEVRRVDGATFELTSPSSPLPNAAQGLTVFSGTDTVYAMDTERGVLAALDPHTLLPRAASLSLTTRLSAGAAVLDDGGRLWVIDNVSGDLIKISGESRTTRRGASSPGKARLILARGNPVLVDTAARTASVIDPRSGETSATITLDLRPEDTIEISGSPRADRIHLVTSRGTLSTCDLASTSCDNAIPIGTGKSTLGAAVEVGNRLFIPDYTDGKVWINDLATRQHIGQSTTLTPAARFQLFTRDGVVFYNDPDSERAGVIRLDGGVVPVVKYDAKDPTKGLHTPPDQQVAGPAAPNPPTQRPPPTGATPPPTGPRPPDTNPTSPNQPPADPPPTGAQPTNPPTSQPPPTNTPPPKPALHITLSTTSPMVNDEVTLRVDNGAGPPPASAQWTYGDGTTASGITVAHRWTQPRTYQITVAATMPDGQQATTSTSITVTAPAPEPQCGDVLTASATLHQDLTCPTGVGLTLGASNIVLDLGGHTLTGQDPGQPVIAGAAAGTLSAITVKNGTIVATGIGSQTNSALRLTNVNDASISNVQVNASKAAIVTDRAQRLRITGGGLDSRNSAPTGLFRFDNQTSATISGAAIKGLWATCGRASSCTITGSTGSLSHLECTTDAVSLTISNNPSIGFDEFGSGCPLATVSDNPRLSLTFMDARSSVVTRNSFLGRMEIGGKTYQISDNAFTRGGPAALILYGGQGTVAGNTFTNNTLCGLWFSTTRAPLTGPITISGNTFTNNGHSTNTTCGPGDGIHIETNPGSDITVSNNRTINNARYGIWATPGTIKDGGGNTSSGNPNGCLGVVCS